MTKTKFHLLSAVLGVLFFSLSCMKVPNLNDELGEVVAPAEIKSNLATAWGGVDFSEVKKGDFIYTEKTAQLQGGAPSLSLRKGITVNNIEKVGTASLFTYLVQAEEITSDQQSKLSTRESKACYDCPPAELSQKDTETEINSNPFDSFLNSYSLCGFRCTNPAACGDLEVNCYRFKSESALETPPPAIAQAPNCRGLKDCKMNVKNVEFVYVIKQTDPETKKISEFKSIKQMKISPDLPLFARLIENCFETFVTISNQKYPVQFCERVRDFQKGTGSAP